MNRSAFARFLLPLLLVLVGSQAAFAQTGAILEQDQHYSVRFEKAAVTAGEPLATQVGKQILRRGGNAVDSATAVGLALAVTLPRAGNIGGGGFALILDNEGEVHALDFRETAPAALHRDYYLDDGVSSRYGATSGGVPGTVAGLWAMHDRFGVLPWSEVVEPARRLAEEGFPVSSWMHNGITRSKKLLETSKSSSELFLPGGKPPRIGRLFAQKDLARTLKRLSSEGPDDFYRGKTARLLVKGVREAGGSMTMADLDAYEARWRKPVSGDFRGYTVWSMPPPSSGGIHLLQMLKWMEPLKVSGLEHNSAIHLHRLAESMRLAYCDRAQYLGDPDFVDVPVERLLSPAYLESREKLIPKYEAGDSAKLAPELLAPRESPDTTHFNVVDSDGMAVSFSYTLNFSFGSGFMAPGTGFLLNNEMDDFDAKPGQPNAYGLVGSGANNVEAGKRPLSSMTPTLVTKDEKFIAALGAPGGSRIITGVFQAALNILSYGYNAQTAVTLPRIHHQWSPDLLRHELGISADTIKALQERGHKTKPIYAVAHVLAIVRGRGGHLDTGLDPRRPASAEGY